MLLFLAMLHNIFGNTFTVGDDGMTWRHGLLPVFKEELGSFGGHYLHFSLCSIAYFSMLFVCLLPMLVEGAETSLAPDALTMSILAVQQPPQVDEQHILIESILLSRV